MAGAQGPAPSRLASPPSIGALLLRSAELGAALVERSSPDSAADLHLRPPTGHYTLMDFNASAADALFEAGFAYTTAELKRTGMGAVLAPPRQLGDLRRPTG